MTTRPTYSELAQMVVALGAQVSALNAELTLLREETATLRAENAVLKARVAELEAQVGASSRNSSKPPSADGPAKPAPKSLRKASGRRPGGQVGHDGSTLAQVAHPDEVVRHEPRECSGCGADLAGAPETGTVRRQVFDIPPIALHVLEHQIVSRRCACGAVTCASAPEQVNAPVQYGPRAAAVMIYLFHGQFLSKTRTARALSELFGAPVSAATVAAATTRAAGGLDPFLRLVTEQITGADVVHFDETSLRCAGRLAWLHSASTEKFSLLHADAHRGKSAMQAMGVLPAFTGIAVHDAFAPYDAYPDATHVLCNAHVLRELAAVTEHHERNAHPGNEPDRWCWAGQVTDALLALKRAVDTAKEAGAGAIDPGVLAHHRQLIRHAAIIGTALDPTNKVECKHRALARRLLKRTDDYLRFTTDFDAPFDNNAAEREVRMAKIRQKVSGCMRTLTGGKDFAALRSYTATAHKHGLTMLDALTRLTSQNPWQPATT
jgi:transposase